MQFDAPLVLYAAPVVVAIVMGLAAWARAARVRRARAWSASMALKARRAGRGGVWLLGATTLAATAALAGPRFGRRVVTTESKALTLVMAVDISRSMLAEDVAPSRLERVKIEAGKLIQDLGGDRLGLIAFAGQSFILSPLTVDDGALRLLVDGLDPDIASAGGTELALALDQGRQLLLAGPGVADRVLVVFTDGEAHDTSGAVVAAASRLRRDGIHLLLVGEGGTDPAPIPMRTPDGTLTGFQLDLDGTEVRTWRRDDLLADVADAAQGRMIPPTVGDQARVIREVVDGLKRAPEATTTATQDISRAWFPALIAAVLLALHTLTRRTAALAGIMLAVGSLSAQAQLPSRNPADRAWTNRDLAEAAAQYGRQAMSTEGGDTVWLNLGTVALLLGDSTVAQSALERASLSLDPDLRYRALFNLGVLALQRADEDPANASAYLADARRRYREALLLRPTSEDAKWNLELAVRRSPPSDGGGGSPPPPTGSPPPSPDNESPSAQGLTREQAEQILNSMLADERDTWDKVNRRPRSQTAQRRRNW